MFDRMEICESVYEGVVENHDKKSTCFDTNHAGRSRKNRVEAALSQIHSAMGGSAVKYRKRYVDFLSVETKICLIHCPRNSSDECKFLVESGAKYVLVKTTKDRRNHPVPRGGN